MLGALHCIAGEGRVILAAWGCDEMVYGHCMVYLAPAVWAATWCCLMVSRYSWCQIEGDRADVFHGMILEWSGDKKHDQSQGSGNIIILTWCWAPGGSRRWTARWQRGPCACTRCPRPPRPWWTDPRGPCPWSSACTSRAAGPDSENTR